MIDRFTGPARSPRDISYAFKWKNTSGETIPAYACVKLDTYDEAGGFYNAVKPDGSGNLHFANGPIPIAVDAYGGSQLWNQSRIGLTDSTTFGVTVGPVSGSWNFEESGSGFVVFSEPAGGIAAILQVGGGGSSSRIWFTIESVYCADSYDDWHLIVTADWSSSGCTATPPGANEDGTYNIYDVCSIRLFYVPEWLDGTVDGVPKKGSATYMYPLTGYCEPKWMLDTICGTPECA